MVPGGIFDNPLADGNRDDLVPGRRSGPTHQRRWLLLLWVTVERYSKKVARDFTLPGVGWIVLEILGDGDAGHQNTTFIVRVPFTRR